MVDSKENNKFDLGVKGLSIEKIRTKIISMADQKKRQLNDCRIKNRTVRNSPTQNVRLYRPPFAN